MNLFVHFDAVVKAALNELAGTGVLPHDIDLSRLTLETPRDAIHGDLTTNAALVLAKTAGQPPRELAGKIASLLLENPDIQTSDVAGPGFINIRLKTTFWHKLAKTAFDLGEDYGRRSIGTGQKVIIQHTLPNRAAPLHFSDYRGVLIADVLANFLRASGYETSTEILLSSAVTRPDTIRENLAALSIHPGRLNTKPILQDKQGQGGRQLLKKLEERDLIYTGSLKAPENMTAQDRADWNDDNEQVLFRSGDYGDETDRPLLKSDGTFTYFAFDVANALDKFEKGFDLMICILDADHGGYADRLESVMTAASHGESRTTVKYCQFSGLQRAQRLSSNVNQFSSLLNTDQVIDEVEIDTVRFMMLNRKIDAPPDCDIQRAVEKTRDNPAFSIQYAYARISMMLNDAAIQLGDAQTSLDKLSECDFSFLDDSAEICLLRKIGQYPRILELATEFFEPHRLVFYLHELACDFHELWDKGKESPQLRFIAKERMHVTLTRLAFLRVIRYVLGNGLRILGVNPVEEM